MRIYPLRSLLPRGMRTAAGGRALYALAATASAALIALHTLITLALRASGHRGLIVSPAVCSHPLQPLIASPMHARPLDEETCEESIEAEETADDPTFVDTETEHQRQSPRVAKCGHGNSVNLHA